MTKRKPIAPLDPNTAAPRLQNDTFQLCCAPEFFQEEERVLKCGQILYFLRNEPIGGPGQPCSFPSDMPTTELAEPNALNELCDAKAFDARMHELEEESTKAQTTVLNSAASKSSNASQPDSRPESNSETALTKHPSATCKRRGLVPVNISNSGSRRKSGPEVQKKRDAVQSLLVHFGLDHWGVAQAPAEKKEEPSDNISATACSSESPLVPVFRRLRGQLIQRKDQMPKPRWIKMVLEEVASHLMQYYNNAHFAHKACKLNGLEQLVRLVREARDEKALAALAFVSATSEDLPESSDFFYRKVEELEASIKVETRAHLRKSFHTLKCWRIPIKQGGPLHNSFAGGFMAVKELLGAGADVDPLKCLDLRRGHGVHLVALQSRNDPDSPDGPSCLQNFGPSFEYSLHPSPASPWKEGFAYIGCLICQGVLTKDCNCTWWTKHTSNLPGSGGNPVQGPFEFGMDEMLVEEHLENYVLNSKRSEEAQGMLDIRRFTTAPNGKGGVNVLALSKVGSCNK